MARRAKVTVLVMAGVLGCGAAVAGPASETIELKFDWGSGFTVLRDIEPAKSAANAVTATSPASAATAPMPRLGPPAYRYRLAVVRQPDGTYEIRVIDFLMRVAIGDLLVPQEEPSRRVIDVSAPAVSLDDRGAFIRLLEPDRALALFKDAPRAFEERLRNLPPEAQDEARAQFEELRSPGYLSARAAFPWFESVGFWPGRRLSVGETYTETTEERYVPLAGIRGPVRVERQWRAVGRLDCEDMSATGQGDAPVRKRVNRPVAKPECVRLILKSTYFPTLRPVAPVTADTRELRYESELDLVTEPATLRPRRAEQVLRIRTVSAQGEVESREFQRSSQRWTYGEPALVALKNSVQKGPDAVSIGPVEEPPNLRPKPVWTEGTPEKAYLDYRVASDAGDWGAASMFLHPEFVARMAKRLRGTEGVRASDALRRELVGDEVTLEQVDALSDPALVLLVSKRGAEASQRPTSDGTIRLFNKKIVLGHVEDREGRVHLVTQNEDEYRFPVEFRGSSSTVAMVLADQRSITVESSGAVSPERCDPGSDALRCWRLWRDSDAEYGAIYRARDRVSPPSRRIVSEDARVDGASTPMEPGKGVSPAVAPASGSALQGGGRP